MLEHEYKGNVYYVLKNNQNQFTFALKTSPVFAIRDTNHFIPLYEVYGSPMRAHMAAMNYFDNGLRPIDINEWESV